MCAYEIGQWPVGRVGSILTSDRPCGRMGSYSSSLRSTSLCPGPHPAAEAG